MTFRLRDVPWIALLVFAIGVALHPDIGRSMRGLQLVPFRTISEVFRPEMVGHRFVVRNVVGNLLLFGPAALALALVSGLRRCLLVVISTALAVEVLQYVALERVADVDDILLAGCGGLCFGLAGLAVRRLIIGCRRYGQVVSVFQEIKAELDEDIDSRVEASDEFAEIEADWVSCMAEQGHSVTYGDDIYADIHAGLNEVMAAGATLTRESFAEVLAAEVELAEAELLVCEGGPYAQAKYDAIRSRIETEIVEQNIARFIDP